MLKPEAEAATIRGAIRTDLMVSTGIMEIAHEDVLDEGLLARAIILVIVGLLISVVVYGVVGLIVKMDDIGLRLAERPHASSQRVGRLLVAGMPKLLHVLSLVGMAAMLWVG